MSNRDRLLRFMLPVFLAIACVLLALMLSMPQGASAEYRYTLEVIFQFAFPLSILCAAACLMLRHGRRIYRTLSGKRFSLPLLMAVGGIMVCVPIFSPNVMTLDWMFGIAFSFCWLLGTLCLAVGLFTLAARLSNFFSGVLCLFASLFLAFSVCELGFLATSQAIDGRFVDNEYSRYALSGDAVTRLPMKDTPVAILPRRPDTPQGAVAHREARFDRVLFDVKYTFNGRDHRVTPAAKPNPRAELLIFGCSFTFGYGLEDEQTWPWLLAEMLGPEWQVENYAYNGLGAQQMLAMLEEQMVAIPKAPIRQALFLAIRDQLRRNSGLFHMDSVTYRLENGRLRRGPKVSESRLMILHKLPEFFNGSQFISETCRRARVRLAGIMSPGHMEIYQAMLVESARILREKYETALTVLLWPDMESMATELKSHGIPVLLARTMLGDWDSDPSVYHIAPNLEPHPNARAAVEIAKGLVGYYGGQTPP